MVIAVGDVVQDGDDEQGSAQHEIIAPISCGQTLVVKLRLRGCGMVFAPTRQSIPEPNRQTAKQARRSHWIRVGVAAPHGH